MLPGEGEGLQKRCKRKHRVVVASELSEWRRAFASPRDGL